MPKPLAIDLFCGLGGWTEGLLAEGYNVVGFDCEQHVYGSARYPAQLVIQNVLTLHGSQFKAAALIVASPPCQAYSYRAMPWKRAKALPPPDNTLFEACFRIQREAIEAAGHHIPLVVENVCGAQKWVGRARWRFGSFYLWGDVPALMPITRRVEQHTKINSPHLWLSDPNRAGGKYAPDYTKVPGLNWSGSDKPGYKAQAFNGTADKKHREINQAWRNKDYENAPKMALAGDGIKQGGDWFNQSEPSISRRAGSKSTARKAASAHIAKIPIALSRHIGKAWYPVNV